ncbi:SDR family oxidoreductase [Membranihabitans maritimus]|uniref:SDR family oxidoreductase n=1 Tax=Membranihabitans maritimus TaxID=2904244 RepID=UPI001F3E167C|nr:SDR family oxidoreductase [Membranihabitans maritimus]
MDLGLQNKVVIVTGGSKGIGGAISAILAEEGAQVIIAGRNKADGQKKVEEIVSKGGKADHFQIELTDIEKCGELVEYVAGKFGRIDGIVNNAGVNDGVSLEDGSPEEFVASFNKNVTHFYSIVQKALPYLKETKGNIVNIGSKVAETGQGRTSGYAASKGAVNGLTREWAVELLPYSIRVNCVIPAEVWTPLYEKWINSLPNSNEKLKSIVGKIPFENRFTTSEEIGNMVAFVLSNKTSGHTTGQILYVDGGYTHLDRAIQ